MALVNFVSTWFIKFPATLHRAEKVKFIVGLDPTSYVSYHRRNLCCIMCFWLPLVTSGEHNITVWELKVSRRLVV